MECRFLKIVFPLMIKTLVYNVHYKFNNKFIIINKFFYKI